MFPLGKNEPARRDMSMIERGVTMNKLVFPALGLYLVTEQM